MRGRCSPVRYPARYLASVALAAMLAAGLGGCQTMSDVAGSLTSKADPVPDDPRRAVEVYGERYQRQSQGRQRGFGVRRGAARHRPARPGLRRYSNRRPSPIPATGCCSALMAARSPTTAIRRPPLTC